ncbi:MAG: hypothetical protein VYB74_02320 [Cyanobacteriota bacterium]|nr:hypothetical protein [Cyanobacteriota bacterium]
MSAEEVRARAEAVRSAAARLESLEAKQVAFSVVQHDLELTQSALIRSSAAFQSAREFTDRAYESLGDAWNNIQQGQTELDAALDHSRACKTHYDAFFASLMGRRPVEPQWGPRTSFFAQFGTPKPHYASEVITNEQHKANVEREAALRPKAKTCPVELKGGSKRSEERAGSQAVDASAAEVQPGASGTDTALARDDATDGEGAAGSVQQRSPSPTLGEASAAVAGAPMESSAKTPPWHQRPGKGWSLGARERGVYPAPPQFPPPPAHGLYRFEPY